MCISGFKHPIFGISLSFKSYIDGFVSLFLCLFAYYSHLFLYQSSLKVAFLVLFAVYAVLLLGAFEVFFFTSSLFFVGLYLSSNFCLLFFAFMD